MQKNKDDNENRDLVEQLKKTIYAKFPITVVLYSLTFVEGHIDERMKRANDYINKVIERGGEASRTLFGITSELILENRVLSLFEGKEPSLNEMSTILAECVNGLVGKVEAGLFTKDEIKELFDHLYYLSYEIQLPESKSPEKNEGVSMVLKVMDQLRHTVE